MTDNVIVTRELLLQVVNAACSPYCAQDLRKLIPEIKALLDAPALEPIPLAATCHCACVIAGNRVVEYCKMHGSQLITAPQAQQPAKGQP